MIFRSLELKNFRQFAGTQKIEFAVDSHRQVTVIHGYNGSGKTTLLNAFIWLFYRNFSPDFLDTDQLGSKNEWAKTESGESLTTSVKSVFEHAGRVYVATRTRIVKKLEDGAQQVLKEGELQLSYQDDDGESRTVGGPDDSIQQILPESLYPFFFFNGERIEKLASPSAYEQVETGIKVLLDIELLERGVKHLRGKIKEDLRREITQQTGDEGEEVRIESEELEDSNKQLAEDVVQLRSNANALEEKRDSIDAKLSAQPDLAALQKEREEKTTYVSRIKDDLRDVVRNIAKEVSNHGYLLMSHPILKSASDILDQAHDKGELPPPLKKQFVDQLLGDGDCICGRPLIEGEDPHTCVLAWREKTESDAFARIATTTRAEIAKGLQIRIEECESNLVDLQERRGKLLHEKRLTEERLSQISDSVGDQAPTENYQALEKNRRQCESELKSIDIDVADKERQIGENKERLDELDQALRKLKKADKKGELAQKRHDSVESVANALERIGKLQIEMVREDVSKTLSEIWDDIAIKDYNAMLDEDFRLRLVEEIAGEEQLVRGASTGEKQILSLAFVASLVKKAGELHERSGGKERLFTGGLFPLVMDSPFGSLEIDYGKMVASWLPKIAPQIIVIVSEKQWRNEVEEELSPFVGRAWILECETPKHNPKKIELWGREYPYVVTSTGEVEKTKLSEVQL